MGRAGRTRVFGGLAEAQRVWVEGAVLSVAVLMAAFGAALLAYLTLAPIFIAVELANQHSTIEEDLRWAVVLLTIVYLPFIVGRLGRSWGAARRAEGEATAHVPELRS